jgi:hypothetical protein
MTSLLVGHVTVPAKSASGQRHLDDWLDIGAMVLAVVEQHSSR